MLDQSPQSSTWSRFRLSVRVWMIVVLLVGTGLGWIVHRAEVQRDAVAAIETAGGRVVYDWQWKGNRLVPNAKPLGPKWLVDHIGVDYFGSVIQVFLNGRCTDLELGHVGRLHRLEILSLRSSEVTDSGLEQLRGLTGLRHLYLGDTRVTDDGLHHLERLTNIEVLSLNKTQISGCGLVFLRRMTGLHTLLLSWTKVGDAGLAELGAHSHLKSLDISGTDVSDIGLVHLQDLTSLQNLNIAYTGKSVSIAGVERLRRALPNLRSGDCIPPQILLGSLPSGKQPRYDL
jgi:Leucine-rich repeat (LRR) protein